MNAFFFTDTLIPNSFTPQGVIIYIIFIHMCFCWQSFLGWHIRSVGFFLSNWAWVKFTFPLIMFGSIKLHMEAVFYFLFIFLLLFRAFCLSDSLSHFLVVCHSTGGLSWPSLLFLFDDCWGQWQSGALADTQRVWICIFPMGVLSSGVRGGYVISVSLKGLSTAASECLRKKGLSPPNARSCACARTWLEEFYETKQVKTTHCVCLNVSSWLSLQGCQSQS